MLLCDHAVATCHSHEDVSKLGSLLHLHNLEAIHHCLHCLDRIDLSHNNLCTETFGTHRNTLSAPAVAGNNHILTCDDKVGCTIDSIPYRLTSTVTVVEKVLAISIVHKHHRELECTSLVELNKTKNTCRSLLAATDHIRNEILILSMHEVHKVTTIIDDDIRSNFKNSSDMLLILMSSGVIPSKHIQSCLNKSSCNIILG